MFEQMKAMGAIAGLLKNRERITEAAARVKRTLDERPVVGEAGGGAVRVTIGVEMKVSLVEIAPAVAAGMTTDAPVVRQIEGLIADATNDALRRAQQRVREAIDREARELGLEGLGDQLGGLLL